MAPIKEENRDINANSANTRRVEVVPYDPAWPVRFEEIRGHLLSILSGQDVRVEHVGSTSVPGLAAKPIIDIDIVLKVGESFEAVKNALEANGYTHVGDLGINGREVFKYDNKPQLMSHHLCAFCRLGRTQAAPHVPRLVAQPYRRSGCLRAGKVSSRAAIPG